MKTKTAFIVILIFSTLIPNSLAQGCSDAGFCTLNNFKPNSIDSVKGMNNQFKIGVFFGSADQSIIAYGSYLEYNRQLSPKFGVDIKLTTLAQNGNTISTFGLSDIFLNANFRATKKINLTLGFKIPLSNANKSYKNLPLPMDYQSSLGTLDLIFGIGFEIRKLQFVAAFQQPLTQNNNLFLASSYPENSPISTFQSTNKFLRSGDVLLRISYPFVLSQKMKLTPSILPIYHLTNDQYTNELNVETDIANSRGLTLNSNIYFDYEINKKNLIQLNMGVPFVVRKVRPDGLTRSFIANFEYRIKF